MKQLQMGYLVYPNATHTRFAHSLGVLKVMQRILESEVTATPEQEEDLRLAALTHDIGHYPYSHLLEGVDRVVLTEERIDARRRKSPFGKGPAYPNHEEVGREILLNQPELLRVLEGRERAERIGNLFARTKMADPELSKLIHSSLDMDRLDYLIRDSQATGVPYGLVDINYLLSQIKQSASGTVGISHKAVAAAEHLLLARSFLFRVVCQHKTTYGFEEAARQLLRRLRDRAQKGGEGYGVPKDGAAVLEIARSEDLRSFTDSFLDEIFVKAASREEQDELIKTLATSIISRRPPRLIWEKHTFRERSDDRHDGRLFEQECRLHLKALARKHGLHPGQFLICDLKPIGFESRGATMSKQEACKVLEESERAEMIRVFESRESDEPIDIVDVKHSILHEIGAHVFRTYRLYVVHPQDHQDLLVSDLRKAVGAWQ
ncbi:MAG: HD domain-containing protein [Verrucomicrobiae bacterium]|nr:HD domain-containing protein [Verrucomicrobiae bacterium]